MKKPVIIVLFILLLIAAFGGGWGWDPKRQPTASHGS